MLVLVVTHDFADYKRGDKITDPALIAEIRDSANAVNVVATNLPDEEPAADATKT